METKLFVSKIDVITDKIFYDKKSKTLSVDVLNFTFIGHYSTSTRISKILDDIYASLKESRLERRNIQILDHRTLKPVPESKKLKDLDLTIRTEKKEEKIRPKEVQEEERKVEAREKKRKAPKISVSRKKGARAPKSLAADKEKNIAYSAPGAVGGSELKPSPQGAPSAPSMDARSEKKVAFESEKIEDLDITKSVEKEEAIPITDSIKPTTYQINMGLQYYSVMMEQRSFLFYIYFSHKELKIFDEEGKTIYETSFAITTIKKEPPVLDLKISGDGFEVHPLFGKVEVKKEAVNPPVMIFSILPLKNKNRSKENKKEGERRFLNVYVTFEDKIINHTVLSIIVQPKHFHLDIGPIHLDISKNIAMLISFLSIIIATASVIYSIFSIDVSSTAIDMISGFAPGLASSLFIIGYLISLVKGVYPLKQKFQSFLNFDKTSPIIK